MSGIDPAQQLTTTTPKSERIPVVFDHDNPASLYVDTGIFEQIQRVAVMMSQSQFVPVHLRGKEKIADCVLVVGQALRWKADPFAVAQHTYVISGKLGYEGKLIAAMVNSSNKLKDNLNFEYSGEGKNRKVIVSGKLNGSKINRTIEGSVGAWETRNEQWAKNPDQMLAYRGAREWARRHMPEVLLGVTADDDIAPQPPVRDITPRGAAASQLVEALQDMPTPEVEVVTDETNER